LIKASVLFNLDTLVTIHTVIMKTRLSFCTYTHQCNAVNQSIFRFSERFTCVANTYIAKTWHSFCSYTQNNSNVFVHMLQLIYNIHTVIAKTWLSFCIYTHLCNAVNQLISIFWSIYTHCNHIHCKDMTQSLLIYTEWQQRLCACAATNIQHSHSYYKSMI